LQVLAIILFFSLADAVPSRVSNHQPVVVQCHANFLSSLSTSPRRRHHQQKGKGLEKHEKDDKGTRKPIEVRDKESMNQRQK
jgi:hypothetical protein